MRYVPLDSVQMGMVLGRAIFGSQGQNLLQPGVEIKPQYIAYLKQLGVEAIYVQDHRMANGQMNDIVQEEVRQEARFLMRNIIEGINTPTSCQKGLILDDEKVRQVIKRIINNLLENDETMVQLMDLRSKDEYLFAHGVQVCILAVLAGRRMNYNEEFLQCLATGALLHDIGMAAVPDSILHKKGDLTRDEYATIKNHPHFGFEIFKDTPLFSSRAGSIILQHHERYNGQGYPQGLEKDAIYSLARIAGIADMYDALTSHRPYRRAFLPHQAIEMLQGLGSEYFDPDFLAPFLSVIAAYPVGTHVVLNTGESGLVIKNRTGSTFSPVVRVLYVGKDLAPHPDPYDLDLAQEMERMIVKVRI